MIIKKLSWSSIREYCIENKLYTNGDNIAYNNLCESVLNIDNIVNDEIIEKIATDIWIHSITELRVIDIMTGLNNLSYYTERI